MADQTSTSASVAATPGAVPATEESSPNEKQPVRLKLQQELFVFSSLMLITCYFLPWQGNQTPWDILLQSSSGLSSSFWVGLLALFCITPWTVLGPRARPWFGIATTVATGLALLYFGAFPGRGAYGAELTKLFTMAVLILSASQELCKAGDLAMRRLNSRAAEVLTHWGTVVSGVQFSAQELYAKVEAEIRERKWPGVEFLRIAHTEAGILSHKREYLRVVRQRQIFDICASGFGKDYFFTLREAEIKAELTLATLIIFFMILVTAFVLSVSTFGLLSGALSYSVVLIAGILLLLNVLRMGLTRLDGILMRMPVIGPIYETFFRRSTTYFQHDSRMVFLKLMDDLVKAYVDEETSAKGVKLVSCFEHQPILDGLYKTSTRSPKTGDPK